jgi:hypothetical protein
MSRDLDGATQFLQVDSTPITAQPLSISCWVRPDSAAPGNDQVAVFIGDKDAADNYWFLGMKAATGEAIYNARSGGAAQAESSTTMGANVWSHLCSVEAANNDRAVFLNGAGKGTDATVVVPAGADRVSVGQAGDSTPSLLWDGEVAHVAIWDVALSDGEVASLAAGVSPLQISSDNLVGYWPINGRPIEPDILSSVHALVLTGAPPAGEEPPAQHRPLIAP